MLENDMRAMITSDSDILCDSDSDSDIDDSDSDSDDDSRRNAFLDEFEPKVPIS